MKIWKQDFSLEGLDALCTDTLVSALGIRFTGFGEDYLQATMPVNSKTVQPMRILHGGASAALAETVGSIASMLCIEDLGKEQALGLELNLSHLRPAYEEDEVQALCRPLKIGKSIHVWEIRITNKAEKTTCIARLSMMLKKML